MAKRFAGEFSPGTKDSNSRHSPRSREAAEAVKGANDLSNERLKTSAENLKKANFAIRTEMERGVFAIEAVAAANRTLVDTIEESLQIADEGKRRRSDAEAELQKMEIELRETLAAAKSRASVSGEQDGGNVG